VYKVTVNFAHGVSHKFEMHNETYLRFREWVLTGRQGDIDKQYYAFFDSETLKPNILLNRDYICSVEIEEV
jgi:hypothetical protein